MDVMKTLKGQLLISSGGLFDPNFRHTVVLIGEHNADGALGVILNRALDVTVEAAVPPLAGLVPPGSTLFEGGPVQRTSPVMLAELARPDLADILVFGGVGFLTGDVDDEVRPHILRARIFAGYSGWGPGQLETEMEADSWIVEPAREEDVFTDRPDVLWSHVLQRKGPEFRRLSRVPYDPTMN
jgi:putative transcriptional regulator